MNLGKRLNIFFFKHRNWGIPNLMLYVSIGAAIVYVMSMVSGGEFVYNALCFNKGLILQGEVWRLITYIFTFTIGSNPILVIVVLLCYASLGRAVENVWGTLRFNLFYLSGILLMDIFAMIFCPTNNILASYYELRITYLLNLTLVISYATLYPDARFMILFVIPVKAWILALLYMILNLIEVFNLIALFPHCLFPLVGFANYLLFFGKGVLNLLPVTFRVRVSRLFSKKPKTQTQNRPPIQFRTGDYKTDHTTVRAPYSHCCTICNRTDTSHPNLEFRYCSRCSGYRCYCEDHISNHPHITE